MEIPSPAEPTVLRIRIPKDGPGSSPDRAAAYANFFSQVLAARGVDASVIGVATDGGVRLLVSEPWPQDSRPSTVRPVLGLLTIAETL